MHRALLRAGALACALTLVPAASIAQARRAPAAAAPMFSPATLAACTRIRDAALNDDFAYATVADLADRIGPRLSGSAGAAAAVDSIEARMKALGVDVRRQPVMAPHWVRGVETAELTAWPGQPAGLTQKVVLTALGGSSATPAGGITLPVVVVPDFAALQRLGRAGVAGKIVLFSYKFDDRMAKQGFGGDAYGEAGAYRFAGPDAASALGAAAALVRSVGGAAYRIPHTGATIFRNAPIPAAAVSVEDADKIVRLGAHGEVRMHLTLTPRTLPDVPSANVIGEIRGSEHPEQIVLVSGHLDSWDLAGGAIDDGAGVANAVQTLHLIRMLGLHPKRTIRAVAWMNEENGTRGARAYAQAEGPHAGDHIAVMEQDLGADHPLGIAIAAPQAAVDAMAPLMAVLNPIGADIIRRVDESPETDIGPMAALGVPAIGTFQDSRTYFDYHHTPADTLDKIVPRSLAENAAVMAVVAYGLADADAPLPRAPAAAAR